jgi:hypothetical protein
MDMTTDLPLSVRSKLRSVSRRLAVGQFLLFWPPWAVAGFLAAGLIALVCRIFFASAVQVLGWLWIIPLLSLVPAIILCIVRRYQYADIVALADSLSGGNGTLLAILETGDPAWTHAPILESVSRLPLPRLRLRRKLWPVAPAAAFLILALLLPQRTFNTTQNTVSAADITADLKATVARLKEQNLITPAEEKKLEEEIERIRKGAMERMDSSSWEAADALREKTVSDLSEKQDALKWAQETLARFAAAAQDGPPNAEGESAELAKAIEKLAESGLLIDAPLDLQNLLGGQQALAGGKVRLPTDPGSLRKLSEMLSAQLAKRNQGFRQLAQYGREFRRFDPSEYPEFSYDRGPDGDGDPGSGGINRGRADAPLTWGRESPNFDKFKSTPLPPGAVRSPDDWAPVAVLPGAPKASPELSASAQGQNYAAGAGQAGWRRTLAPRHHSVVKKYFDNSTAKR